MRLAIQDGVTEGRVKFRRRKLNEILVPPKKKETRQKSAIGDRIGKLVLHFHGTKWAQSTAFSSPEAALLLVSTKNRAPGQVQHRKSAIHGLPVTLRMFRVESDKSDWLWSQSIVFTNPFKTGMSFDRARGRDSWC